MTAPSIVGEEAVDLISHDKITSHSSCSHVSDINVTGVVDLEPLLQIMSLDARLGLEDR